MDEPSRGAIGPGGSPAPLPAVPNRALLLPYAAPYLAYVGIASILQDRISVELNYGLRLLLVPALLLWARRWFVALTGPRSPWGSAAVGAAVGLAGGGIWIALLAPFVPAEAPAWGGLAFGLRFAAAGLVVPLCEELLMRGYLLRLAYQWDAKRREGEPQALAAALDEMTIFDVAPGAWSGWAVVLSTVAFAAGHQVAEWPAALAFGALMAGLWAVRRDLLSCVVAHAAANVFLAIYVRATGAWGLW